MKHGNVACRPRRSRQGPLGEAGEVRSAGGSCGAAARGGGPVGGVQGRSPWRLSKKSPAWSAFGTGDRWPT